MNDDTYEVTKYNPVGAILARGNDWSVCVGCILVRLRGGDGESATYKPVNATPECYKKHHPAEYIFFHDGSCFTEDSDLCASFKIEIAKESITGDPRVEGEL